MGTCNHGTLPPTRSPVRDERFERVWQAIFDDRISTSAFVQVLRTVILDLDVKEGTGVSTGPRPQEHKRGRNFKKNKKRRERCYR